MTRALEYVTVARLRDVRPGRVIEVEAGDRSYALANVAGTLYAIDNNCPHMGGPLSKGTLNGANLTCPWHAWTWDVTSGRNRRPGVDWRAFRVPVRVVGDEIQLPVL
jgi:nitrite reductase/ring-hydroxylating ferredoxin subunit